MESLTTPWKPSVNWNCPAGNALLRLLGSLPLDRSFQIVLFGSAPLQLTLEPGFSSADVDLFADDSQHEILRAISKANLEKGQAEVYVQCCWEGNFRAGPRWRLRSATVECGRHNLIFPHPIDILIAKLHRYEEKDKNAFLLVRTLTGHPSDSELMLELQHAVDLFRPNFDEENSGDILTNTAVMWPEIFGREIDVRKEIIAPALQRRRSGYEGDSADYRAELWRISEMPTPPKDIT